MAEQASVSAGSYKRRVERLVQFQKKVGGGTLPLVGRRLKRRANTSQSPGERRLGQWPNRGRGAIVYLEMGKRVAENHVGRSKKANLSCRREDFSLVARKGIKEKRGRNQEPTPKKRTRRNKLVSLKKASTGSGGGGGGGSRDRT